MVEVKNKHLMKKDQKVSIKFFFVVSLHTKQESSRTKVVTIFDNRKLNVFKCSSAI